MTRPNPLTSRRRDGFTLIELLIVLVIIGILVGLLSTAIAGALRRAKETAVSTEIGTLATALADFKSTYGEYPPSRIMLIEFAGLVGGTQVGQYPTSDTRALSATSASEWYANNPPVFNPNDITVGELAQRSLRALKKFFPRAGTPNTNTGFFHDYNGNGTADPTWIYLEGHECLAFFLGGVPNLIQTDAGNSYGMTGFAKDPIWPFKNSLISGTAMSSDSRYPAKFQFKGERLVDEDGDGMPGYVDSLTLPQNAHALGDARYYAYFYSNNGSTYDPNDVNFFYSPPTIQVDPTDTFLGTFRVNFPAQNPPYSGNEIRVMHSPAPNPYTNGNPVPALPAPTIFQLPDGFQIISAGTDRKYGAGGSYNAGGSGENLPAAIYYINGSAVSPNPPDSRVFERDNLTNFSAGRLE